jgi:uncharacterized protein (TIGR02996 family)
VIADDDPTAQRLREAVWDDPDADAPRMVFADYFLDAGDPLGELVALQLERARTGDPPTEREIELADQGRRAAGPLQGFLLNYTLERGFLATATPLASLSPEIVGHRAWATVRRLSLLGEAHLPVLANQHLAIDTLCAPEVLLAELSRGELPLPCAALAGVRAHRGLDVSATFSPVFEHQGAFDRVRAISLGSFQLLDRWIDTEAAVRDGALMRHVEHLDLTFTSLRLDDLQVWRRWFHASSTLARITFQIPLGATGGEPDDDPGELVSIPNRFACLALDRGFDRMFLQVEEPSSPQQVERLVEAAMVVRQRRTKIAVHDLGHPARIEERQPGLTDRLRARFAEVVVATGPVRPLAP